MYPRILDLNETIQRRSLFLFGPRATGKSTFLRMTFPQAGYFDLLEANTFARLIRNPGLDGIQILPVDVFLKDLWSHRIL